MSHKVIISEELVDAAFQFFYETLREFQNKFSAELVEENINAPNAHMLCACVFSSWVLLRKAQCSAAGSMNSLDNIYGLESYMLEFHKKIAEECEARTNAH